MAENDIRKLMTREDHEHIHQLYDMVPELTQQQVWAEYQRRFREAMTGEPDLNKRTNAGRRAANDWLRRTALGK